MLGLPSTTHVGRRVPKEAFYKNLKLDGRTRDEFVHVIERIEIAHSIKPSTVNIADGGRVHEILVLSFVLKSSVLPLRALDAIAGANQHKLIFLLEPEGVACVVRKGVHKRQLLEGLNLVGRSLDEVWDSVCAHIIFGDADGSNIDARIDSMRRRAALEEEITTLEARARKAKQINRKNELFTQLTQKKRELDLLGKGK